MEHRRLFLFLLCALVLFSLLACEISGNVVITVVPPHAPPGHPPPPGIPPPPEQPPPESPPGPPAPGLM